MRISDWSSDVCSSDLPCRRPQQWRRTIPGLVRSFCASLIRAVRRNMGPAFHPSRSSGGNWHLAVVSPLARSEEHTSELQSLMRTSYVVFCFKKNKNHMIFYDSRQLYEEMSLYNRTIAQ